MGKLATISASSREQFLHSEDLQDRAERSFHIAIECLIDVGNHVIAGEGWGPPDSYGEVFRILGEKGVLSAELSLRLEGLAGFRNILVRDYLDVDAGRVYDFLSRLDDFREFAFAIVRFAQLDD